MWHRFPKSPRSKAPAGLKGRSRSSRAPSLLRREHGQVAVMAALLVTVMLGFAGLATDAGLFYAQRRQAQNGADNAAVAGARIILEGGSAASAQAAALDYASANGYDTDVTVNIPPAAGEHAGDSNYVEVTVAEQPKTFFIQVLVPGSPSVQARGVAGLEEYPEPYALIVLDADDCQAYRQQGGASLTVSGGGVMINSDCDPDALSKTGSGSISVEGSIDVHGGSDVGGSGSVSPAPETAGWTVNDPLAGLAPPPRGAPAPGTTGTAANPQTWRHNGGDLTLSPGTYYGGFYSNCTCTITMQPGIYIMSGGGFGKAGGAGFVGDGVMIYVTTNPANSSGDGGPLPFDLAGSGALDLSPPTSGTYQGITLWQDAAITSSFKMRGSNDSINGVVYVPGATLDVSGDSTMGTVQLIVNKFLLSGNAPLELTYGDYLDFDVPRVALVE
ncbi:MAG: pilus assembly protein TadG-related protein [Dehalococcoidia bacterium]|nr:pilus assembly protein TadG-related protein [Dehalococcoidia bacterium]